MKSEDIFHLQLVCKLGHYSYCQQGCSNSKLSKHENIMFIAVHAKKAWKVWFACCEPYIFTAILLIKSDRFIFLN
jgi:hypothetical protein